MSERPQSSHEPDLAARRSDARVLRLASLSLAFAFGVMGLKLLAWWLTGSVALLSDALESIVNVIAASVALMAISLAQKPADDDHPFGHTKAEYFSAVLEGVLIVVAALVIIWQAVPAFVDPEPLDNSLLGIIVNLGATAVNAGLAYVLLRAGRQERSPALEADGRHIMTDVWTSVGVVVALVLCAVTGWLWLDPAMAVLVALNILYHGGKVIISSLNGLLDRAVDPHEHEEIERTIQANATDAIEVHDIRTRIAGRIRFIEFHLVVDGEMTVEQSHRICDRLENAIHARLPGSRVTIHVEPHYKAKPGSLPL